MPQGYPSSQVSLLVLKFVEIPLVFRVLCCCVGGYLIGGEQLYVVGLNLTERQGSRKN